MRHFYSIKRETGFSIVELMVAITLGLILVAATITLWVSSKLIFNVQSDLAEIQETGRFGLSFFQQEMREAGYFDCVNSVEIDKMFNRTNSYSDSAFQAKFRAPRIDGVNGVSGAADEFTLRGFKTTASSIGVVNDESTTNDDDDIIDDGNNTVKVISANASDLNFESPPKYKTGQIVAIADCNISVIFEVASNMSDTDLNVSLTANGNADAGKYMLGIDSDITTYNSALSAAEIAAGKEKDPYRTHTYRFFEDRYYISGNSLMRQSLDSTDELLPGVESMQILYGVDSDSTLGPNSYVTADNVSNWDFVVSMKIAFLVRSQHDENGKDSGGVIYTLLDQNVSIGSDKRRRKVLNTEVSIRNYQ